MSYCGTPSAWAALSPTWLISCITRLKRRHQAAVARECHYVSLVKCIRIIRHDPYDDICGQSPCDVHMISAGKCTTCSMLSGSTSRHLLLSTPEDCRLRNCCHSSHNTVSLAWEQHQHQHQHHHEHQHHHHHQQQRRQQRQQQQQRHHEHPHHRHHHRHQRQQHQLYHQQDQQVQQWH